MTAQITATHNGRAPRHRSGITDDMKAAQSHTFYTTFYENPSEVLKERQARGKNTKSQSGHETRTQYAKHHVQERRENS